MRGKAFITYENVNWVALHNKAFKQSERHKVVILDAPDYPQPSTTRQRRRSLPGHRGVVILGPDEKKLTDAIRRKKEVDGKTVWGPVGIWRGMDAGVVKAASGRYNGAKLRAIRAVKGVGRPWVTLLPSTDAALPKQTGNP